jgi:hypothetical protein
LSSGVSHSDNALVTPLPDGTNQPGFGCGLFSSKPVAMLLPFLALLSSAFGSWTSSPGEKIWKEKYAPCGAINLGISSDGTENVLWRLQHGVLDPLHPK